jgi:TM2 domain-containing membrane protein YozV
MFNSTETIQPSDPPKNAIIALILSLILFGGVGQMYLGQMKKGIILIVATIVLACVGIGFLIPILGAIDAYMMADKLQKGESIGDMQWFWES